MASTCLDFHSPILFVILVVGIITGCVVTLASLLTVGIVRARNKERRVESRRASRRIGSKQWRAVLSDPRSQRVGTETSQCLPVALRGEATPDQVRFTPGNDCGDQIELCSLGYDTLDYWQHLTADASTLGVAGHNHAYDYGGGSIDVTAASDF
ncbi:uncharacterized protein LOC124124712 [Haliotis rufescens]|uniref:uncharacterized protein LOC124124712 n=1 Tax=Haliotis rufescens TaxID=6454 RepID=UPI00201F4BB7|nr:uncharacterized protein LOC124124712 [Haliotis rufescens]XP_048239509.1 uncharacterized protein LOC124124712 [Haliotis rufescens]